MLIDKNCPVRPCVMSRDIDNCAHCDDYICEKLKQRIVNKADIETKLGRGITSEEYELFIAPYESQKRLKAMRRKINGKNGK